MNIETGLAITQLSIAIATLCLAIVAFLQFRESIMERRRSMRIKVLQFLYLYHKRLEGAIAKIPKKEFNMWDIKRDILNQHTEEFFSLPKNLQLELERVSLEYEKTKNEKKSPEKMKNSLENLKMMIEKEIDSLVSKLDLDQV